MAQTLRPDRVEMEEATELVMVFADDLLAQYRGWKIHQVLEDDGGCLMLILEKNEEFWQANLPQLCYSGDELIRLGRHLINNLEA